MLFAWPLVKEDFTGNSKNAKQLRESMERLILLHNSIAYEYLTSYISPRAKMLHGLTSAVPSHSSLDITLRLFDIVGRVGTYGL